MPPTQLSESELEEVRSVLANQLGPIAPDGKVTLIRVKARGQHNILLRANANGLPYALAVKICLHHQSYERNGASAVRQFNQLTHLFKQAKEYNFDVIEPVCACERSGILVTKWVTGPTLSSTMRTLHANAEECSRDFEKAGAWLSAFHSMELAGDKPLETGIILDTLVKSLDSRAPRLRASRLAAHATRVLDRSASVVDGILIPQRAVHGDFHPGNLIKSENRLIGLDIEASRIDHNLNDLVTWMNHINHMTMMPRCLGLRMHIGQLNAAFLRGYQANKVQDSCVNEKALLWLRTLAATSFYERYRGTGETLAHESYFRLAAGYNLWSLCKALNQLSARTRSPASGHP